MLEISPKPAGIGISTAGQVDKGLSFVRQATENLSNWTGVHLKSILEEQFGLPVWVENDVNAAALGEAWLGSGKNRGDIAMITLGTGIGGAIIKDGNVYRGINGAAGEFGHIRLYRYGLACTCGLSGCYEQYASTGALVRKIKSALEQDATSMLHGVSKLNGETIFQVERKGDILAREVINDWIYHIAWGLSTIIHSLNPELIIIGGGISREGEYLVGRIRREVRKMIMQSFADGLEIVPAMLSNNAGIIGAAYIVLQNTN